MAIKVILATLAVTLLAVWGAFSLAPPSHWTGTAEDFRGSLAMSSITAITHLAAATLFLMSLDAYKSKLRVAYIAIALGVTGTALGTVQLPVLDILGLANSWWVKTGAVTLPFLLSGIAVYAGARRFAALVGTQTLLARVWIVLPIIVGLLVASTFLPHAPTGSSEIAFDTSTAVIMWTGLLFGIAALMILKTSRRIGVHYLRAMVWLSTGLLASTTVTTVITLAIYITGSTQAFDVIIDFATVAAGVVYMIAGYVFYKTREL